MFDFNVSQTNNEMMNEAVINYDTSDFTMMVQESDQSIGKTIDAYRSLMTQTLTESAGVINEDATLIMEEATEHIGQKLLRILKAIKDWIVKKFNEIVLALQNFVTSNKKVVDTVAKNLRERNAKGDFKDGPTAELYNYKMDVIDINRFADHIESVYKTDNYDLTGEYTSNTAENLDKNVKLAAATAREAVANSIIKQVYKGPQASKATAATVKMLAHEDLRSNKGRETVKFTPAYIDILEANAKNEGETKKNITKLFTTLSSKVDKMISDIKSQIKDVKGDSSVTDKKLQSGKVAFFNEKIRLLNIAVDVLAMLNAIKLQASIERVNEAKKFCVKAYHYKAAKPKDEKAADKGTVQESASEDYPYAFSLIETGLETVDDTDLPDGGLEESANW